MGETVRRVCMYCGKRMEGPERVFTAALPCPACKRPGGLVTPEQYAHLTTTAIPDNAETTGNPETGGTEHEEREPYDGPLCPLCGGEMDSGGTSYEGTGCLVILAGILLAPLLIGIPLIVYGIYLFMKRDGTWVCVDCDHEETRRVKWNEGFWS